MAISLSGGVYLEIKINDIELPPANNVFRSLTMHSGIGFEIPVAILEVNDMHDMFNTGDLALVDGSKIEITFGKGNDEAEPRTIKTRILGKVKTEAQSQGYKRTATLIPDLPEYILEVQREAYTGTSDSVLSEIFGKYSIEVSKGQALTCQDSMTWRNIGRSQIQFVKDIVSKAYSGPQTCVKAALDWDTFYINDLFQELKQEPEIGMFNVANVSNKEGAVSLRESSIDTSSGFFNKLTNYGRGTLVVDNENVEFEKVKYRAPFSLCAIGSTFNNPLSSNTRSMAKIFTGNKYTFDGQEYNLDREAEVEGFDTRVVNLSRSTSNPIQITNGSSVVANYEVNNTPILFDYVLRNRFSLISDMLIKTKVVEALFNLTQVDFRNFDFRKPVFVDYLNDYFIVNDIKQFKANEVDSTNVTLIRL